MFPRAQQLAAVAGLASLGLVSIAVVPVSAQTSARPSISIAALITAQPATEILLPIFVTPVASIPRNSFVRMRGLPPIAALSAGHTIAPGSWAIPLEALPGLKMVLPTAAAAGRAEVVVTLVAIDGAVLAETKSALVIQAVPPASAQSGHNKMLRAQVQPLPLLRKPVERTGPSPQIPPAAMLPEDRERALKLLKEGNRQMAQGNIAAARVVYELAAEASLAEAAMALAGTYDAVELARLNVRGIQPNTKEARRWYERAEQLGASDAVQRLQRLGGN